jgi:HSP20 family protein
MAELNVTKAMPTAFNLVPFNWMRSFFREMDRAFDFPEFDASPGWCPAIECKRTNGTFLVTAEVPGIEKDAVEVEVADNNLVLHGERKMESKKEEDGYFRTERSYGAFHRTIALPEGAKPDEIKAELPNGVLTVKVPVAELKPLEAKKIPVSAN